MLIFVSDIHLADHPSRGSFRPGPLFSAIRVKVKEAAARGDRTTLVLLGDIFELIKSSKWPQSGVRPWHHPDQSLLDTATEVLRAIRAEPANAPFFDEIRALQVEHGIGLRYLPGNHDGLLSDAACGPLRQLLRESLPGLQGAGTDEFDIRFVDADHGVIAEHGHLLDPFNRRSKRSGRFVPGDAVVVEMLVGLPRLVAASHAGLDEFSDELAFLHEMDNVEPQSLSGLMRWLEFQLNDVRAVDRSTWEAVFAGALRQASQDLMQAMRANSSQSLARKALWTMTVHRAMTRFSLLRKLAKLPEVPSTELPAVAARVGTLLPLTTEWPHPPDVYVAGHTHEPRHQAFATTAGDSMTYLNTGTCRRVQVPVRTHGTVAFQEVYREALVCVHRRQYADSLGRYELARHVRGN